MPVAGWWLAGLLLLGVGVLPLVGADTRAAEARGEARVAAGWVGETAVVEGVFDRLEGVRDVVPGIQAADAVYVARLASGDEVEVVKPARRDDGVLDLDLQPARLLLRVPGTEEAALASDGPVRAVQWGPRLTSARVEARRTEQVAGAAEDRAGDVRLGTLVGAGLVVAACVAATVRAARRPRRGRGWFAGTRPAGREWGELPVGAALLVGVVLVVPPSTHPAALVLAGLVVLGACALLAREGAAVDLARSVPVDPAVLRRAALGRAAHGVGVALGLLLLVVPVAGEREVTRGIAMAVLSATVVLRAPQVAGPDVRRPPAPA